MATGSIAQPHNNKRDIAWVVETDIVYSTVWVDPAPAASPTPSATPAAIAPALPSIEAKVAPKKPAVAAPSPSPSPSPAPAAVQHAPAANGGTSSGLNSFEATCVDSHNSIRAQHGAGKLTWDNDLAASAAALANQCNFHHDV